MVGSVMSLNVSRDTGSLCARVGVSAEVELGWVLAML